VRTARKPWRCRCADPIRSWKAIGYYTSKYGGESWTSSTFSTEAEAQEKAATMVGKVAGWDVTQDPAVPSAHYERAEVIADPNPNHRDGCLGDIAVGDRYFEYLGESFAYESGYRYCASCAAVWVGKT